MPTGSCMFTGHENSLRNQRELSLPSHSIPIIEDSCSSGPGSAVGDQGPRKDTV